MKYLDLSAEIHDYTSGILRAGYIDNALEPATCPVTMWHLAPRYLGRGKLPICGASTVAHGLCEKHYADRIRLGGAA